MAWGVITANKQKADMMFDMFEKEYEGHIKVNVRNDWHYQMILDTGKTLVWANPYVEARSQRLYRVWVDKDLDEKIIREYCSHIAMCPQCEYDWI